MENVNMLILDIDGTLIARGSETIRPAGVEALHQAQRQGIKLLIATGRAYYFIQQDVHDTLKPDYYVTINGQCLIETGKGIIEKHEIQEDTMIRLNKLCDELELGVGYKFDESVVCQSHFHQFHWGYLKGKDVGNLLIDDTAEQNYQKTHGLPMGLFIIGDEAKVESITDQFPELTFTWSYPQGYDIYSTGNDKTTTIESVLKRLGISWAETMAFGDGENDIPMLVKAGVGVAVANAKDNVKAAADYIAPSVDEDGVAKALRHFGVIA